MKILMMFCTAKLLEDRHNKKIEDNYHLLFFLGASKRSDRNGGYFDVTNYYKNQELAP